MPKLHEIISDYIEKIDCVLQKIQPAYIEKYEAEIINPERADIRIRIRFSNGCLLELNEAVYVECEEVGFLGYRYHFQDCENRLIFRYDNTPRFPNLESFPDHKHTCSDVLAHRKPSVVSAVREAAKEVRLRCCP